MARLPSKLSTFDITLRQLEKFEQLQSIGELGEITLDKFKHPELAEEIFYWRDLEHFEEYCANNLKITTKDAQLIPFKWKKAQRVYWEEELYPRIKKGLPIRDYILKGRQIGFSTLVQAIDYHRSSLFCNINSNLVAHNKEKAGEIFNKVKLFWKTSPKHLRPTRKLSNRSELFFANPDEAGKLGLESLITIQSAENRELGVASTLHFIHLSEFAKYEKVNSSIKSSLVKMFQALSRVGGTIAIIETTAEGEGLGKEWWDNKKNGFSKTFISWIADDQYSLKEHNLKNNDLHVDDTQEYGNEVFLRDIIISEIKKWYPEKREDNEFLQFESLNRLAWRREYIDKQTFGDLDLFKQEYPTTAEEAFLISGSPIFNSIKLKALEEYSLQESPEHYTYLRGDSLTSPGEFIPVRSEKAELKIFRHPKPEENYYVGADIGAGVGGDNSILIGLDSNANQVFEFKSDYIEPNDLSYPLFCLLLYYNNAYLCPEANSYGLGTINYLTKVLGYTNIYRREQFDRISGKPTLMLGFYTSRKTRPILINNFRQSINSGRTFVKSKDTVDEMKTLALVDGRIEASYGNKDDRVFAYAMALYIVPIEGNKEAMRNLLQRNTFANMVKRNEQRINRSIEDNYLLGIN